jgi:hypothetical protein
LRRFAVGRPAKWLDEAGDQVSLIREVHLDGPNHIYVAVNLPYRRIIAGRDVVGTSMADALPDAPQGEFIAQLNEVRASGQARFLFDYQNRWDRRGRGPEIGWVSQWLQPMRDEPGQSVVC